MAKAPPKKAARPNPFAKKPPVKGGGNKVKCPKCGAMVPVP